jgi:LPS export ABC transporter protein LptC
MSETRNIEILYSDSGYVRVKVLADLRHDFSNGDWDFPEGLHMVFFDKLGDTTTTLISNQGHYDKEENLFTAVGDVQFQNVQNGDQLRSEELNWVPQERKFYSDKPTEVTSAGDILTGTDFEAAEDFSWFVIRNNTGEFNSVF